MINEIGGVERVVTMIGGSQAVNLVSSGFGNDTDHSAGSVAKFGCITCGDYLEFRNSVLIELCGCATAQFVLVGKSINQESGVIRALPQHWCRGIAVGVGLAIDGHSRNELQQVKIISAVDRHVFDFLREDGCAVGGRRSFKKRNLRRYVNNFFNLANFKHHVERQRSIQRNL